MTAVHKDVTERLRHENPQLYKQVKKILEKNKQERHIRGGMATKRKYKGEWSMRRSVPGGRMNAGWVRFLINACWTIQKYLNLACWCKLLNCSGARFLHNFAKKPCTLKRITFWFFLKSGDNQWILTVKTKVLTHKIEILTRFYIIAFANAIIQ